MRHWIGKAAFKEPFLYLRQAEGAHSPFLTHGIMASVQALPLHGEPQPAMRWRDEVTSTQCSCARFNAGFIAFGLAVL